MKAQSIILSVFVLFASFAVNAQAVKKETIKVWGNCGMCKKTIEKSAIAGGATSADWNTETKVLTVSYNTKKTNNKKIQQSVAASGYDTQDVTGSNEAYDKLHGCCKYDRKQETSAAAKDDKSCCDGEDKADKSCCKDGGDKATCKDGEKPAAKVKKQQ